MSQPHLKALTSWLWISVCCIFFGALVIIKTKLVVFFVCLFLTFLGF
jgi:hypothetical protein